jgi:hypothetical protein
MTRPRIYDKQLCRFIPYRQQIPATGQILSGYAAGNDSQIFFVKINLA